MESCFVFSWNHAFKNQITTLQGQAKNRANPNRSEVQANLSLFLEAASGFYTQVSSADTRAPSWAALCDFPQLLTCNCAETLIFKFFTVRLSKRSFGLRESKWEQGLRVPAVPVTQVGGECESELLGEQLQVPGEKQLE